MIVLNDVLSKFKKEECNTIFFYDNKKDYQTFRVTKKSLNKSVLFNGLCYDIEQVKENVFKGVFSWFNG